MVNYHRKMESFESVEFGDLEGYLTVSRWISLKRKRPVNPPKREYSVTPSKPKKYVDIIEYAKLGMISGVRTEISRGKDVNEKDTGDDCAIAWAVKRNDLEMTKLLVSAGADLKSIYGTLLMYAHMNSSIEMTNFINKHIN